MKDMKMFKKVAFLVRTFANPFALVIFDTNSRHYDNSMGLQRSCNNYREKYTASKIEIFNLFGKSIELEAQSCYLEFS